MKWPFSCWKAVSQPAFFTQWCQISGCSSFMWDCPFNMSLTVYLLLFLWIIYQRLIFCSWWHHIPCTLWLGSILICQIIYSVIRFFFSFNFLSHFKGFYTERVYNSNICCWFKINLYDKNNQCFFISPSEHWTLYVTLVIVLQDKICQKFCQNHFILSIFILWLFSLTVFVFLRIIKLISDIVFSMSPKPSSDDED